MQQPEYIPCSNKHPKITYTEHDAIKLPKKKKGRIIFFITYVGKTPVASEKS